MDINYSYLTDYWVLIKLVHIETTYWQFMGDNERLWMGAFKSMRDTEHGTGILNDYSKLIGILQFIFLL